MEELLFIETIRVEDGIFVRPEFHLQRMRQTVREAYGAAFNFDLADGSIRFSIGRERRSAGSFTAGRCRRFRLRRMFPARFAPCGWSLRTTNWITI